MAAAPSLVFDPLYAIQTDHVQTWKNKRKCCEYSSVLWLGKQSFKAQVSLFLTILHQYLSEGFVWGIKATWNKITVHEERQIETTIETKITKILRLLSTRVQKSSSTWYISGLLRKPPSTTEPCPPETFDAIRHGHIRLMNSQVNHEGQQITA